MTHLTLLQADENLSTMHSDLLGELQVRPSDVFHFPQGILGFPECRKFALLRGATEGLFWLQSIDYSALVFLLIDPFSVVPHYSIDVPPTQLADLGGGDPADMGMLAVVTLPPSNGEAPTVNLQGPLAINFRTRRAKQIVCGDAGYGVRCPIDLGQLVA